MGGTRMAGEVTVRVPLGELGAPEHVADAVAFLASDESTYVTGAQLVVGGALGV
jgi:NAD(P)-dependent dehydrogenase (short-subunit alcohol dehydrogenase family)